MNAIRKDIEKQLHAAAPAMIVDQPGAWADSEPCAPQFLIDKWLPRSEVTLLGAHGGSGKSTLALVLAAHVACGIDFADHHIAAGHALFLSLEDRIGIVRHRLRRIVHAYRLDADLVRQRVQLVDGAAVDAALAFEQRDAGISEIVQTYHWEQLAELARGFDLVVIDNASDAYDANANDPREVRKFVRRMLGKLARDNNSAVLLLAHIDKSAARFGANGNTYTGTTAWHNSARSRLALIAEGNTLELVHEKHNLSAAADPLRLRWDESGMLYPLDAVDAPEADDEGAILAALERAARDRVNVSTARTGPGNARVCLARLGLPPDLTGTRFDAALNRLRDTAKINVETYQDAYRHEKTRFVLPPSAAVRHELTEIADRRSPE